MCFLIKCHLRSDGRKKLITNSSVHKVFVFKKKYMFRIEILFHRVPKVERVEYYDIILLSQPIYIYIISFIKITEYDVVKGLNYFLKNDVLIPIN